MVRVVCLLLSIATCSVTIAQPLDAVCRITVAYPGGSNQLTAWPFATQQDSGGWRVFFMTNAHGFRETVDGQRSATVYPPSTPPVECDSIDYLGNPDGTLDDLAVVSGVTRHPPPLCELEQQDAAPGQPATLAGYPTDEGRLRTLSTTRTTATYTAGEVGFGANASQGMSGGPVFSAGNRVCAMIASSGPSTGAICMPLRRIRQVVANVIARRQARRGVPVCVGPRCQVQPAPRTVPTAPRPTDLAPMPRPALGGSIAPIQPTPKSLPQQPIVSAETSPPAIDPDNQWVPAPEPRQQPVPQTPPLPAVDSPAIALTEPVHYERNDEPSATDQPVDWDELAAKAIVTICGMTGVAIPTWLVIAWRGARRVRNIRRRRRRRIDQFTPQRQSSPATPSKNPYAVPAEPPEPAVLLDQAPPPPQAIYKETKFANVESDSFQHAYDWARRQAIDGYPGVRPALERLDGLITQHLASQNIPRKQGN